MSGWVIAAVVLAVVGFLSAVLPREVRLYRRARVRRGGLLELDTPACRAAIADPDDWFDGRASRHIEQRPAGTRTVTFDPPGILTADGPPPFAAAVLKATNVSSLQRCNPARDVHYFGGRSSCECGARTTWRPFASGDDGGQAA